VSVQLDALADEVFGAAAAQGRAGGESLRRPFGEIVWNRTYPDLFFLNGIENLVAPDWEAADLERVVREAIPRATTYRASSRDPATISALNPRLIAATYTSETRVAMVQVSIPSTPSPSGGGQLSEPRSGKASASDVGFKIVPVGTEASWTAFQRLIHDDTQEHGWTGPMEAQLIALYRWRAANTPHHFYLAENGTQTIGHVGLLQHGTIAYLHGLYTHPSARRRGAGAALTLAMSAEARALGCERLTLQCTRDSSLPAYYSRLGFRAVGEKQIWTRPVQLPPHLAEGRVGA
jgi:N-acetylglutamate synthase-like GNAT family acetyltransferase